MMIRRTLGFARVCQHGAPDYVLMLNPDTPNAGRCFNEKIPVRERECERRLRFANVLQQFLRDIFLLLQRSRYLLHMSPDLRWRSLDVPRE